MLLRQMTAGTVNCPSCGASISDDSTQCRYCHSQLQTVSCPSCFGMMFRGSKFCPHCGAAASVVEPGPSLPHDCPRCRSVNLQRVSVGGVDLEECAHCGGLWVTSAVFEKICTDREAQEIAVKLPLPPVAITETAVRYVKCPQCHELMNRTRFANRCGVIIDRCRPHGIWLDRDEIRKVIEFIRAGGMAYSRQAEIEELKRQRERLENASSVVSGSDFGMGIDADEPTPLLILKGIGSVLSWLAK